MLSENEKVFNRLKTYLKDKGQEITNEWYVKIETRKSGKSEGVTDNYYFSPNGIRFRSMIEVYRFLTTGDKFERDEETKCLKITEDNTDAIMDSFMPERFYKIMLKVERDGGNDVQTFDDFYFKVVN